MVMLAVWKDRQIIKTRIASATQQAAINSHMGVRQARFSQAPSMALGYRMMPMATRIYPMEDTKVKLETMVPMSKSRTMGRAPMKKKMTM